MARGGRLYKLRRKSSKVNYFTFEDYNTGCSYITSANNLPAEPKKVVVQHQKDKTAVVSSLILDMLKANNITVKRHSKYASSKQKYLFVFNSKQDAQRAAEIINKMAVPDYIVESNIQSNGIATTASGLKFRVDMNSDGKPANGGAVSIAAKGESGSTDGLSKYLLIAGIAVVVVLLVVVVVKKLKKK